jgi:hypothetical protein
MLGIEMWQPRYLIEHPGDATEVRDENHRGALDLTGYSVEALDGAMGKVDQATYELDGSAIVVDTGPWIFGTKVLIPAGIIDKVDVAEETVWVHRMRDEIKGSPPYDDSLVNNEPYRTALESYYGPGGLGYREFITDPRSGR